MKNFKLKHFSLTIFLLGLFIISLIGQFFTGFNVYQAELEREGLELMTTHSQYLFTGHFISSVAENMESEFLQMGLFVFLTIFLYQIGSAESKRPPEQEAAEDRQEKKAERLASLEYRKKYGWLGRVYENSLTLSLGMFFLISFFIHAYGSMKLINVQNQVAHEPLIGFIQVFSEPDFWFESFQNWQSEFFSIAMIGILSIFLRQKGSPQSKKIYEDHWATGN